MRPTPAAPRFFAHLYRAFAAGYLLSHFYCNVNAVISTEFSRELTASRAAVLA